MHEVRDVQPVCMVTLTGHAPPRWEHAEDGWCRRSGGGVGGEREGVYRRFRDREHRAPPPVHSRNFSETPLLGTPVLSYKVFVLLIINGFHLALHLFGA